MIENSGEVRSEMTLGAKVIHRCRKRVITNAFHYATQCLKATLNALRQCLKRFGRAEFYILPIRIGQHTMQNGVLEWAMVDRNGEILHARKVDGQDISWLVHLIEGDILLDAMLIFQRCTRRSKVRFQVGEKASG